MKFGQVCIGPPGCGKSTYCSGMSQFCNEMKRSIRLVNLDPANDILPYTPDIDITKLIRLEEVMDSTQLGPNGALVYCMQFLEKNIEWLYQEIHNCTVDSYFIFDLPGQIELYTHEECVKNIFDMLHKKFDFRLTIVHLVDSHHCTDGYKFVSVLLLSLSSMIRFEFPHVNVLSKIDLIESYGKLAFNLDFYTEVLDLSYVLDVCEQAKSNKKFYHMTEKLIELIEDYSLVRFLPLNIEDRGTVLQVLRMIDKSNGYTNLDSSENYKIEMSINEETRKYQEQCLEANTVPIEETIKGIFEHFDK